MATQRAVTALFTLLFLLATTGRSTQAQGGTLDALTPVSGVVESGGEQSWTFNGTGGSVISLLAEATGGTLDPAITLLNSRGEELIRNDDYAYPANTNALLQAITLPANDQYTLQVSGTNGTSGDYNLTLTPGYAELAAVESFSGNTDWNAEGGELSEADGRLTLAVQGTLQTATATRPGLTIGSDFFAETRLSLGGADGWIVGFVARQQGDQRYLLKVNDRGEWRLEIQSGEEHRILRDWTAHPVLAGGQKEFRLGMLANGSGMDFFFDGQLFGRFTDSTLNEGSGLGFLLETVDALNSRVSASFDELVVTIPRTDDGEPFLPQALIAASPADLVRDLQRQSVIPPGGELAFNVEESFVESRVPGVEAFLLARDSTFGDLVAGGRVTLQMASPAATGCGLIFGSSAEDIYHLAYVDATGGRGVSGRDGDSFEAGVFAENPPTPDNTYDLLVIAVGGRILYYVDQRLVGILNATPVVGAVGNAVVNFEPVATSCQFNNTWVWRWENLS